MLARSDEPNKMSDLIPYPNGIFNPETYEVR